MRNDALQLTVRAALAAALSITPTFAPAQEEIPLPPLRERLARVVALEDQRSFGDGWLQGRVFDPHPEVRRQAVLALGRIGRPEAIEPLLAALAADEAGAVRSTAAFALGILEDPLPEEAVTALVTALTDSSGRVREKAIEALGRRGGEGAGGVILEHLAPLVRAEGYAGRRENVEASLRRTSWDEARLGLFALARIRDDGGDPGSTLSVLGEGGAPRTEWWAAAWTAARLRDPELLPLARAWAAAPDPLIRALGVRGLGSGRLTDELLPELSHPSETVRIEAFRALTAMAARDGSEPAEEGDPTIGRLLAALRDPEPALRREAVAALARVTSPEAVDPLIDQLQASAPDIRASAFRALYAQDEEGFFLLLSGWSDRDPLGRLALARALPAVHDPRVRDFLLETLLPDEDSRVRAAALRGLGTIEEALSDTEAADPNTASVILEHLNASDVYERAATADALGRLGSGIAEVRQAFAEDTASEPEFRIAALRAGIAHGTQSERIRFAREALTDAAWPVRREAHEYLRKNGETPEAPAPADALDASEYEAMLYPPFTPVAWVETAAGDIEIELFIADAPRTVWRFMSLAREGFYDGLVFHRVVPNFVVQAGDPRGDGLGGAVTTLRCEINERFYMRGSVGMALDGKDTGSSQFFITLLPQPHLNGRYTLFGQVRAGFGVLDRIQPGDRIRRIRIWDGITPPS